MAAPGAGARLGDAYVAVSVDASKVGPELEAKVDAAMAEVVSACEAGMVEVSAAAEEMAATVGASVEEVGAKINGATAEQRKAYLSVAATAEAAQTRVVAAKQAEKDATDRVIAAEAKLAEARAAGGEEKVAAAAAGLTSARGKLEVATSKVSTAEAVAKKASNDLAVAQEDLGKKSVATAETVGSKWAAVSGLVGGAAVVVMIKSAGDYQQALTKLATTAGESQANLKQVGDGMLSMAGEVGISAQHLAEGMYTVESAGFHGADGLTVLRAAAQGAKQENADLHKVTDAVTTALHDYNLPASDAAKVTSQLITAVAHGKTNFDELTGSMHSVTPLAASMHMSLAETAGALSAMTASGMSADQASQNLADALRHLQSPTQPMINQLAQLGIRATDLSANLGQKGLAGTTQEISAAILQHMGPSGKVMLDALNKNKEAAADMQLMIKSMPAGLQTMARGLLDGSVNIGEFTKSAKGMGGQAGAMGTQFLSLYKSADGFSQILKSGSPAAQTYTAALQKAMGTSAGLNVALQMTEEHAGGVNSAIADIAGAVPEADGSIKGWSEVQGNFNQKLAETWAAIQSWAIQLGQKLLPVASQVLGVVQDMVGWLEHHSGTVKTLTAVIGGLLAAMLVYKTTVGAIALATKAWEFAVGLATAAQRLLGIATAETNVAMELNPIGLLVVLIVGLVAAVIYAWNHFQWFRDAVIAVGHAFEAAGKWIAWLAGVVWSALGAALEWVKGHWPLLLELLAGPIGWAIAIWTNFGPKIMQLLGEAWRAISGWFVKLPGEVGGWLMGILTTLGRWGMDVLAWFAALPGRVWTALVTFGPKIAAAIGNGLVTVLGLLADFVVKTIMFFVTLPIKIAIALYVIGKFIWQAFLSAFQYLQTNIPIWLGIALRFFEELPGRIWNALLALQRTLHDAFWTAIDKARDAIVTAFLAVVAFFEAAPGRIWGALSSLGGLLRDLFWRSVDGARQIAVDTFNNLVAFFTQAPGRIGSALASLGSTIGGAFVAAFDWAKRAVVEGIGQVVSFIAQLPGRLGSLAGGMLAAGEGLIHSLMNGLGNAIGNIGNIGAQVVNSIIGFINSHVIDNIDSALNFNVMGVQVHAGVIPHIPFLAQGGVIDRPTLAIVGEDGPEAVVPLTKPGRAAQVMGAAGLGGGGGGGVQLTVNQQLTVPRQATAAEAAALFEQNLATGLRLGARGGISAGLAALGGTS